MIFIKENWNKLNWYNKTNSTQHLFSGLLFTIPTLHTPQRWLNAAYGRVLSTARHLSHATVAYGLQLALRNHHQCLMFIRRPCRPDALRIIISPFSTSKGHSFLSRVSIARSWPDLPFLSFRPMRVLCRYSCINHHFFLSVDPSFCLVFETIRRCKIPKPAPAMATLNTRG